VNGHCLVLVVTLARNDAAHVVTAVFTDSQSVALRHCRIML
jgi:hypothetical protein